MIQNHSFYKSFEKKIVPYLDGSLPKDELAEFEAFILTHPDFEEKIKVKRNEIEFLRAQFPAAVLSANSRESLETEMKASIYNLLKEEPKTFLDHVKLKWEEFISR